MVGRVFREFAVTISVAIMISGFVSLTLTPMLCARVLQQPSRGRKAEFRAAACSRRCSIAALEAYEWALDQVLKAQGDHARGHLRDARRHRLSLHHHSQGLLPDRGYRLHLRHPPRRRPISPSRRCRTCRPRSPISFARTRRSTTSIPSVGAGRRQPDAQHRPHATSRSSPRSERGENSTAVIQRLRVTANTVPGMAVFFQNVQNINITGRIVQERIPILAAIERHRGAVQARAGNARQDRQDRRACATSTPISTSRIRR